MLGIVYRCIATHLIEGLLARGARARGLNTAPLLGVGVGALGFWAALEEAFPQTRHQRCWVHKTANVRNALPKSLQARAKAHLHDIWMAPARSVANKAFDHFRKTAGTKYPKATEKLEKDREALLAFHDLPAEHWIHLRTTNPIESTFATVRHRTTRTKNCVSRSTFPGLAFKLVQEAEKSWRRIRGVERIGELLAGRTFKDGLPAGRQACQPTPRMVRRSSSAPPDQPMPTAGHTPDLPIGHFNKSRLSVNMCW